MELPLLKIRRGLLNIALKWGQGVGRDGKGYGWLIDCRELLLQDDYLELVCNLLWERLKVHQPQAVGGLTLAANPLTIGMMYAARRDQVALKGVLIRKSPKEDGLQRQVEGPPLQAGERVVLLDDLINSGETQRVALAALRKSFCRVPAVGVLIDYQRQGSGWLEQQGVAIESLFSLADLGMELRPGPKQEAEVIWTGLNANTYRAPKSRPQVKGERLWVGSDQGEMLGLSWAGELLWRSSTRDRERGIHASPALVGNRLLAGSYDGYMSCWDADQGNLLWERRLAQWIGSSVAIAAEVAYVGLEYGRRGGAIMAFRVEDGSEVWRRETRDYVHSSPAIDVTGQRLWVGCNDRAVRALSLEQGEPLWEFACRGKVRSDVLLDEQGMAWFCCSQGWLYAVRDGELCWERQLGRSSHCTPCLLGDCVVAGGDAGRLLAFQRDSGELRWIAPTPNGIVGGPQAGPEQTLLVADLAGSLSWLDSKGQTLGRWHLGHPFLGRPQVVGHRVWLAGAHLWAVDLPERKFSQSR